MAEEKDISMMDLLAAQQTAAEKRLTDAETEWQGMKNNYKSAYKGMLANLQPEIDTEKEKRLRNMGKTQAITDFLTALTTGIIGGATKGYAPQVGANAQPYAVNLENLREINKQRIENYKKLKAQADLSLLENDLKDAQSKYQVAAKGVADANEARNKFALTKLEQQFKADENAKNRAAHAAEKDDDKNVKRLPMGNAEVYLPKTLEWENIYSTLVEAGVPAVQKMSRNPITGLIEWVDEQAPTPDEIKHWAAMHSDKVLPHLAQFEGVVIKRFTPEQPNPAPTPEQTPYYDTATPTGSPFAPKKEKEEVERPKFGNYAKMTNRINW